MTDTFKINMPPGLNDLRNRVLSRTIKRMPKWKFRIASKVVMQLQPKPEKSFQSWPSRKMYHLGFEGFAIIADAPTAEMLKAERGEGAWLRRDIKIAEDDGGDWYVIMHSYRCGAGQSHLATEVDKVIEGAFAAGMFDVVTPKLMLSPNCLMCGKALTDAASMARMVGPECSGTSSIRVPKTYLLDGARP